MTDKIKDAALENVTGGTAEFEDIKREEFEKAWDGMNLDAKGHTGTELEDLFTLWQQSGFKPDAVSFLKNSKLIQEGKPEDLFVMPNADISAFLGKTDEALPTTGRNVRIFFTDNAEEIQLISTMARELNVDFSICRADMTDFRGKVMGSLVLNVSDRDAGRVLDYLHATDYIIREDG